MKHLVLSDLHANLEALHSVLEHASPAGCGSSLVLGDIVGYGPDPVGVVEAVGALRGCVGVRGNHDRVVAGHDEGDDFNPPARAAAHWTRRVLTGPAADFLRGLPQGPREFAPRRLLCHGSPLDEDEYLLDHRQAQRAFEGAAFDLCFFGHTHLPCVFALHDGRVHRIVPGASSEVVDLQPGRRHLVNPGSVGQPRDRNPHAAYAVYDDAAATVTFHRVPYPLADTRRKILDAGLPSWLGDRLTLGV